MFHPRVVSSTRSHFISLLFPHSMRTLCTAVRGYYDVADLLYVRTFTIEEVFYGRLHLAVATDLTKIARSFSL